MIKNTLVILFLFNTIKANQEKEISHLLKKHGLVVNVIITNKYDAKGPVVDVKTLMPGYIESAKEKYKSLSTLFAQNKYKIFFAGSLSTYLYIIYQIKKLENLLNDSNCWCNWKSEIDLQKLLSIDCKELYTTLYNDINSRYSKNNDKKNAEFEFVSNINKEMEAINNYLNLVKYLKKFYLIKFFKLKDDKLLELTNKQNKLVYLKKVITSDKS